MTINISCLQADYEQEIACQKAGHRRELARSKDDLLQLLASAEAKSIQIDEDVIRRRYTKELDRIRVRSLAPWCVVEIAERAHTLDLSADSSCAFATVFLQEMSERGYAAMEKSHQRVIMEMRRAQKKELDLLRQEKDQLLDEETKATQAGIVLSLCAVHTLHRFGYRGTCCCYAVLKLWPVAPFSTGCHEEGTRGRGSEREEQVSGHDGQNLLAG